MILNNAKDIKLGSEQVDKIYKGSTLIWESTNLPSDYQEVKCIYPLTDDYTSYFDTRVALTNHSKIVLDYQVIKYGHSVGYNSQIFGSRFDATTSNFSAVSSFTNKNLQFDFGDYRINRYYAPSNDFDRHTIIVDSNYYNFDGVNVQEVKPVSNFTTPYSCCLFYTAFMGERKTSMVRIYNFKIYENDILVADLVPCYRKIDNVVGFYDSVRNLFITKTGDDTFTYDL